MTTPHGGGGRGKTDKERIERLENVVCEIGNVLASMPECGGYRLIGLDGFLWEITKEQRAMDAEKKSRRVR